MHRIHNLPNLSGTRGSSTFVLNSDELRALIP